MLGALLWTCVKDLDFNPQYQEQWLRKTVPIRSGSTYMNEVTIEISLVIKCYVHFFSCPQTMDNVSIDRKLGCGYDL